jgi:hypothetical protein
MSALATQPQIGLGLVCCLLLGGIAYNLAAPIPDADVAAAAPSGVPTTNIALPVFQPPPAESFAEVNARSVFERDRGPVASDSAGPVSGSSAEPPVATLIGVIIDGDRKLAMIRSSSSPVATSVAVGDSIEGWRVSEIDPDKIVLRSGTGSSVISLRQNHADAAPAPAAAPPGGSMGAVGIGSTVAAPTAVPDNSAQTQPPPPQPPH